MQASKSLLKESARIPLQPLSRSSLINHSANPSQTSFSVYEDTRDESSFLPYHDSMQASGCFADRCDVNSETYTAPLEAPVAQTTHSVMCQFQPSLSEQTFTQIDIGHPATELPISTPNSRQHKGTYGV